MVAICHKCGALKSVPAQKCGACGCGPVNDDDLALAFMLTDRFLSQEKLAEIGHLIRDGKRFELPPHIRTAVRAAIESARTHQATSQKGQGLSLGGWGILACIAAIVFLVFHPWPHYQWSVARDSVSSYEGFVNRFPSSAYADSARVRISVLMEPEVWSQARETDQIEAFRRYVREYPNGKHLDDAKIRISEIADAQWNLILNTESKSEVAKFLAEFPETTKTSLAEAKIRFIADGEWRRIAGGRSVTAIQLFLKEYPETSLRSEAEQRIQELYNDWNWVREQDSLDHYQRFAARNPDHPEQKWIEKRIIDLEVKAIAAGDYGEIARAQPLSYGGSVVEVAVENQTGYELTVRYSGPDSRKLVIPKGATGTVALLQGEYKVAASVTAANVMNYFGTDSMRGGRYSSRFYIQPDDGRLNSPSYRYRPRRK